MANYSNDDKKDSELQFNGKVAVITNAVSQNPGDDEFNSVKQLIDKYGSDKIIHAAWPLNFTTEKQKMIDTVTGLAADMEIKAIVMNQTLPGADMALNELKKLRNDIFVVCCTLHDDPSVVATYANLLLETDMLGIGKAMIKQAKKQGAKVFVHYSFPRHMSFVLFASRRKLSLEACLAEGMQFVDATAPDPMEAGVDKARQFILEDVPRMVAKYGEDTSFYSSNCHLQMPLIKAVVDCHAIYTQPCCPSPFHGFPEALGIETGHGPLDLNYLITEASRIAEERNMTDRLSTWPVSAATMYTNVGAEYAIKWVRGEVSKTAINDKVLEDCINAYVKEAVGEGVEVTMTPYTEAGKTYNHYKMVLMSYLDF